MSWVCPFLGLSLHWVCSCFGFVPSLVCPCLRVVSLGFVLFLGLFLSWVFPCLCFFPFSVVLCWCHMYAFLSAINYVGSRANILYMIQKGAGSWLHQFGPNSYRWRNVLPENALTKLSLPDSGTSCRCPTMWWEPTVPGPSDSIGHRTESQVGTFWKRVTMCYCFILSQRPI